MTFMDSLPSVISCCFCCFLRAGAIVIALVSFATGMLFVPNINHTPGFWDMDDVLGNFGAATESTIQIILGGASLSLCISSVMLIMGICFNMTSLILIYQWGALVYSCIVFVLFFVLSIFCFFVYENCVLAGVTFVLLMVFDVLCSTYFIIVTNSLRMSMNEVLSEGIKYVV